jgi:elongation factor G
VGIPPERVRTVAVVGHTGSGKTTLVEALLTATGAISRMGRVEDGTTVSDHEPEEKERGGSLLTTAATATWTPHVEPGGPEEQPHLIQLLDCPGDPDLLGQVDAALHVADLALVVVGAADGVQVGTELAWRLCDDLALPRLVVLTGCDKDRADVDRVVNELKERFGKGIAPLELPVGSEAGFRGVLDLLSDQCCTYEGGQRTCGPIPAEMVDLEHAVHDQLVEGIVEGDDDLMMRYLEGDVPSVAELEKAMAAGVASGSVFPVVLTSSTLCIAVDRLADFLCEVGPSPLDRPTLLADGDSLNIDPAGPTVAVVWRTIDDRFQGRLSLARCLSGTITPDTTLRNCRTGTDERLHQLLSVCGANTQPVSEVTAGQVFAVAKLTSTGTGDTLSTKGCEAVVEWASPPPPAYELAIAPKGKADDDKLMTALHRLQQEDPWLAVRRDDEAHQTVLGGRGGVHLQVALQRLQRKFAVEVETGEVAVPYRETIRASATAEGKYKKQTGGHGQFGVCTLVVEPLPRGAGFEWVDAVVGGAIPRNLIPAVEKGVIEAMGRGGPAGHQVVDVRVTLTDGKHHPVDSSEMSFKAAGALAFNEALAKGGSSILEPVRKLEVTCPPELQGDVLGDLKSRRGRVVGADIDARGDAVITALVPAAELRRYAVDLRSLSSTRATFTVEPAGYEERPAHLANA